MSKQETINSTDESTDQRRVVADQLDTLNFLVNDIVVQTKDLAQTAKDGNKVAGIKDRSDSLELESYLDYDYGVTDTPRESLRYTDSTGRKITENGFGKNDRVVRKAVVIADTSSRSGPTHIKEETTLTPTNSLGFAKRTQESVKTSTDLEAKRRTVAIVQKREIGDSVIKRTMNASADGDIEVRQVTERPDEEPVERVWKTNRTRSTKQELTEGQRHDMHVAARIAGKMVKSASRQLGPNAFNSDATVEAKRRKGIEDAKRYALELQSKGVDTGGTYRDKKKNEEL